MFVVAKPEGFPPIRQKEGATQRVPRWGAGFVRKLKPHPSSFLARRVGSHCNLLVRLFPFLD